MTADPVFRQTIDLVLSAIYLTKGDDRLLHSFLFGPPNEPAWNRRLGIEIFYDRPKLLKATLYLRQQGGAYLKEMSVGDVWKLITNFIQENFWYLSNDVFFKEFDDPFSERVSEKAKNDLANALAVSNLFRKNEVLVLYPLVPIRVSENFDTKTFFLIEPLSLDKARLPVGVPEKEILAGQFPPLADWTGKKWHPNSWLGIRSPTEQLADKKKSVILGAVALLPHPRYRYMFSGRQMIGGRCILNDAATCSFEGAHTPPLMEDIVIGGSDCRWLELLGAKLNSNDDAIQKEARALECYYRAWPLDPSHRFPLLFTALDALFGDPERATQALIEAIPKQCDIDSKRLRLLLKLRGSVVHGGAPNVHESEKYQRYYEAYNEDPIYDLERVTARCLRTFIFGDTLEQHPHPHPDVVPTKILDE